MTIVSLARRALLAAALLPSLGGAAFAQGAILQAGPRTAGHAPMYVIGGSGGQTTVQDSGPASGGAVGLGLKELLITKRGTGTPPYANQGTGPLSTSFCMYDAPTDNAGGFHYLCLDPNAQGGALLTAGAGGGASQLPFGINVNGNAYSINILGIGCTTLGSFPIYTTVGNTWICSTAAAPQAATLNGTLNLAPLAGSIQQGINISQSGPTGGSVPGLVIGNLIQGSMNTAVRGDDPPGNVHCACWSLTQLAASLGSSYDTQSSVGVPKTGQAFALAVGMVTSGPNTTASDVGSGASGTHTDYDWHNSRFYGWTSSASVGPNGAVAFAIAHEFGVALENTIPGNVPYRAGINLNNYGTHRASVIDTAISFVGGNNGGEWGNALTFLRPPGVTVDPLATTANIINAVQPQTINSIIEASNWTITSYVYNTQNAILTGAGVASFGSGTSPGGIALKGGALDSMPVTFQYAGVSKWQLGASATTFFLGPVGSAALNIAFATGNVSLLATTAATTASNGALQVAGGVSVVGAVVLGTYVQTGAVAVGSLPSCAAGTKGARHFVTDSNAASFTAGIGAVVAAGGTTNVPVTCDGTNWRIG